MLRIEERESIEEVESMRKRFYSTLNSKDFKINSVALTQEKYRKLIEEINYINTYATKKNSRAYWLLKHYSVVTVDDVERLAVPSQRAAASTIYYATKEELFDILHQIHKFVNHGGRDKMIKEIRKRYKNITQFDVRTYLALCRYCTNKNKNMCKAPKTNKITKSIFVRNIIDIIDFQSVPDEDYNFILICRDQRSKFIILKPMKTKSVEDIALTLFDIFTLFGAPAILNYDRNRMMCTEIIDKIKSLCNDFLIINGIPLTNEWPIAGDIENEIRTYMKQRNYPKWKSYLSLLQYIKNNEKKYGEKLTPFNSMFVSNREKSGLYIRNYSKNELEKIKYEEELDAIIQYMNDNDEDENDENRIFRSKLTCAVCFDESLITSLNICYGCTMFVHHHCSVLVIKDDNARMILCMNCNTEKNYGDTEAKSGSSNVGKEPILFKILTENQGKRVPTVTTIPDQIPIHIITDQNAIVPDKIMTPTDDIDIQKEASTSDDHQEIIISDQSQDSLISDQSQDVISKQNQILIPQNNFVLDQNQLVVSDQNQIIIPDQNQFLLTDQNQLIIPNQNQIFITDQNQLVIPDQNHFLLTDENQILIQDQNHFVIQNQSQSSMSNRTKSKRNQSVRILRRCRPPSRMRPIRSKPIPLKIPLKIQSIPSPKHSSGSSQKVFLPDTTERVSSSDQSRSILKPRPLHTDSDQMKTISEQNEFDSSDEPHEPIETVLIKEEVIMID